MTRNRMRAWPHIAGAVLIISQPPKQIIKFIYIKIYGYAYIDKVVAIYSVFNKIQ
jgi:hypothetical protein